MPHIWKLANIVPNPQQRHRQGHLIHDNVHPLSNCKETGEEHVSLHNCKHTKHIHATRVQNITLYSDGTTHSKQHRSKGVQPNGSPARTITVALDISKFFNTINIHTIIRKLLPRPTPRFQAQPLSSWQNYIKGTQSLHNIKKSIILSPTLYNIYTVDISPPRALVQVMAYASPLHLHTRARV